MRFLSLLTSSTLLALSAVAQVPSNLVADGIPEIPKTLREEAGRYLEFRSATMLSWQAQRREMLVRTRFADTPQVHLVAMPGGARRQLTFAEEPVRSASFRPRQGGFFVFARDTGGGEFYQLYRDDLDTGRETLLTDGKSRNSGPTWTRSGRRMAYTSTRRTGKDTDIYVMNPGEPASDRLVLERAGGGWNVSDWSDDESKLLLTEYISANESRIHMVEVASGQTTPLTPPADEKIVNAAAKFARDGKGIFFLSDLGSEFQQLVRMDLETRTRTVLTADVPWDVDEFELSPDGTLIAFISNEDGVGVLRLLDVATGQQKPLPKIPVGVPEGLVWHENGRDLGFTLDSARSPSDAYSLNVATGEVSRWTESETGGIDTADFREPELVKFPGFEGLPISAFVYRPDPKKFPGPRPALVYVHGGPEAQFRPGFMGRNNFYLNELGCAIVAPNVRGSAGYGKKFLTLDNGMKREDSVRDIGAVLDWIAQDAGLDAGRVAVLGGSYGGYMVLAALTHFSDRLRCGIDIVGISNFVSFLQNTQDYRRDLRRVEYGDERDPEMAKFLERIAPLNQVEKITSPLLVVQGKNDPRVPVTEAEQIVQAMRAADRPCWYLLAEDEGHGFAKKKNADFQFLAQILFLREFLLVPKMAGFDFRDWLIAPVRVHLLSSEDTPELQTTLAAADIERIFGKVNRVWAPAGIRFQTESIIHEAALPASADAVDPHDDLFARLPPDSRNREVFHVYYVKQLGVNGFYTPRGIFVKDTAALREVERGIDEPIPRVTSHELGHGLGLPHRQNRTNLMASGTTGISLNDPEIQRAREHAHAIPWIQSAATVLREAQRLSMAGRAEEAHALFREVAALPLDAPEVETAKRESIEAP
ncbi:MAG: alpha/beta fold hydrolase [Chthoniobacteraceae bacterium]